jgi:anti-sigma factor RsiW
MLVLPPVEPEPKPDPEMAARQAHWGAEDAARKATWRAKQHAEQPWQAPPGKGERSSPPRTHAVLSYEVWVTSGLCLAGFIVFGTTLTIVQALTH